jgi:hypothetical protein
VDFSVLGEIASVETFASGGQIRELKRLRSSTDAGAGESARASRGYGFQMARSGEPSYTWYEATGVGRKEFRIKRYVD